MAQFPQGLGLGTRLATGVGLFQTLLSRFGGLRVHLFCNAMVCLLSIHRLPSVNSVVSRVVFVCKPRL